MNIREIRALHAKATPGPLRIAVRGEAGEWFEVFDSADGHRVIGQISPDDAEFFIAARDALPALLDIADAADSLDRVFRGSIVTESAIGRRLRDALVNLRAITDVHGDEK